MTDSNSTPQLEIKATEAIVSAELTVPVAAARPASAPSETMPPSAASPAAPSAAVVAQVTEKVMIEASTEVRRCRNGHAVAIESRFCSTCGCEVAGGAVATPAAAPPAVTKTPRVAFCQSCHNGSQLKQPVCEECQRLKPLAPQRTVDPALFQWAQDAAAMQKLRSLTSLQGMAKKIAHRVGKPWIESTFNGVRVNARQLPHVHRAAVNAARILGITRLPAIYVSGQRPWDAATYGSEEQAFVVVGAALATSLKGAEMQFILGREMGHIVAGHAIWKTVIRFLVGEQQTQRGFFSGGVTGLLDPGKWLEGAIELPLLNWARQAEITADRAGLLVAPNLDVARRALLIWSLKSPLLYPQINLQEWLKQQEGDAADGDIQLAECVNSSTPYLSRRLKLLSEYEVSPVVGRFRQQVRQLCGIKSKLADAADKLKIDCPACQKPIQVAKDLLRQHGRLPVRCPHPDCAKVNILHGAAQLPAADFDG